ncbi:hypothetical protein BKA65DRAFT_492710 [Rhexocercosporidium sp. MPI-PUGE-AT-0058]|nr:hypothetical protein BKA65DRAFT_492710 [Rhexocercosporidium sp. MPI-PUGE-AT-0058]
MEALAALGLAAAVVQFVDFGSRLVSKGQQLYHSGALLDNVEIEDTATRLQALVEPLQASQGEDPIVVICKACVSVSQELVNFLGRLKMPTGNSHERWKSFRQALKSVSSKEKVKEIKLRLDSLRGELDTHVVLNIRGQISVLSTKQDTRFGSLDTATQNIMLDLLDLRRAVREDMGNQFQHLIRTEHLEHNKTRTVLTDHTRMQLDSRVYQSIIESLHFPARTVRHEKILDAHMRTFEWIFQDPKPGGKPWSHFGNWLESGERIYWISGKAGSGKSTLMKFIVDHDKTREMLGVWARGTNLETPSFFFWSSGDPGQRSQEGLLRSLLYEILIKHPELVPVVFPELWKRQSELASSNVANTPSTWTLAKLKNAFARLVAASSLWICFFIDGLDEYDGDYEELAEYFSGLACSTHVKLCLSSRPWPAFQDKFQDCAGLRLQDLTWDDIYRFVNDTMESNANMIRLRQSEPVRTERIVSNLIWKAQGVFLWVTLVVKSLLKGLSHRNNLETLEKRLNAMPPDLENLYSHMLASIDAEDMEDGSKIFQLCYPLFDQRPIDMELVYHALKKSLPEVHAYSPSITENDTEQLRDEKFNSVLQEMHILLQTRCGGLLEIHVNGPTDISWKFGFVFYIHRTVSDFLKSPDVWKGILSHTSQTDWDPRKALLISIVMCLKSIIISPAIATRDASVRYVDVYWTFLMDRIYSLLQLHSANLKDIILLLDELDKSAARIALVCRWSPEDDQIDFPHWSNYLSDDDFTLPRQDFLSFATENGLWNYVQCKVLDDGSLLRREKIVPLLAYAVLTSPPHRIPFQASLRTIELLLHNSADPNVDFRGNSLWQYWLSILHAAKTPDDEDLECFRRGTVAMIQAGASLKATCVDSSMAWGNVYRELVDSQGTMCYVSVANILIFSLMQHASESWKNPAEDSYECLRDRDLFVGKETLSFRERHCLKAVIDDVFRERDPNGADEILHLVEKLEVEKASGKSNASIIGRKRNIEEVDVD